LGGEHFGKRMRLKGIQDSKQLLEDQTKQMIQKKQKNEVEKAGLKMKDYQDMLQLKEEHIRDEIEREVDNKSKQLLFKQEMQQMHQQKILKQQQEKAINDLETYDYFPYTHGENIDNMQENYRRIVLSNRAYQNQCKGSKSSKSVSNRKVTTQSAFSRTGLQNPVGNDKMIENDKVGRFRSSQRHPEVIKSALERFENTLLVRENQKLMEEQTFKDQIEQSIQ